MELFEAIGKRHSYRGPFTDAPVREEDLRKIVQAGIQAPSGKNEQTTSFVILNDPALVRQAAEIINRPACQTARAMIVCVTDPRPTFYGHSFHAEDCAAAVENMLLAITALGYASVWLDGVLRLDGVAERLAALLGVPGGKIVRIVLPLGVPAEAAAQRERLPFESRAWFNRYGA
ncbi:MAG: nitroreductase family protein [Pirellulales bacterium]|jgi:nitroreductase|nr:nitroreductase family protein [Thermoguttaceae bacterium]MDD4786510.1 nitroreductase family protein [Pirellulales bacterium]MDI9446180.1 nitroreductase family protein [Planctomycetota bacterium]NLY99495.1 nitroreductase [Pirellulaceae bacterium]